jgi:cell division protein FtsW
MSYQPGEIDYPLLACMILLAGFGFVMSYSVSDYLTCSSATAANPCLLRPSDIRDPGGLAARIQTGSDPVAGHLGTALSDRLLRKLPSSRVPANQFPAELRAALAEDLNRIILAGPLYDSLRFHNVALSRQTREMLARSAESGQTAKLNRMLLHDAFPDDVAGIRPVYSRIAVFNRELRRFLAACIAFVLALTVNYRKARKLVWAGLAAGLVLLALTLVRGTSIQGSKSWIFGFQPVDLVRFFLVLCLADYMARHEAQIKGFSKELALSLAMVLVAVALVVKQHDVGSALALSAISLTILFAGGANLAAWGGVVTTGTAGMLAYAARVPHIQARIAGFWVGLLEPDKLYALSLTSSGHLKNSLSHVYQSLLSIGSGGLFGVGLGQSRQKFLYIPEADTDFIFSIIGEEVGLVVTGLIWLLFLVILWRGIRIARQAGDRFESLAALGLSLSLFIYAAINVSVTLGLFPITGLPLPFLSHGGTALAVNAATVGLLLNISKHRGEKTYQTFSRKAREGSHSRWWDGRSSVPRTGRGRGD